jgi:prepilin-type N-terminal cleavage/methylation domain-containing protein
MKQCRRAMPVPASHASAVRPGAAAFTLIEMSIVLVIIGLIVGGVLAGQSLINAAAVRATISQIEKYQTNTFRGKYGYLPGDIKDPDASNFGFAARGQYAGEGDGNGVLEGNPNNINGKMMGSLKIPERTQCSGWISELLD